MPSPRLPKTQNAASLSLLGALDKVADQIVLRKFAELWGEDGHIVIIPTASQLEDTGDRYVEVFLSELGIGSTDVFRISEREDANCADRVSRLQKATGIFMTGGNQLRLSTPLVEPTSQPTFAGSMPKGFILVVRPPAQLS